MAKRSYAFVSFVQFALLTWKNYILFKRSFLINSLSVLMTVVFPIFLLIGNLYFGKTSTIDPSTEPPFELSDKLNLSEHQHPEYFLAFTPDNNVTKIVVGRATSLMNDHLKALGCDSESDVEQAMQNSSAVFGGIVFLSSSFTRDYFSNNITYKIRLKEDQRKWFTKELIRNNLGQIGPRQTYGKYGESEPGYFHRGFLTIQRTIDSSIITTLYGTNSSMRTFLKKLAYPGYVTNTFMSVLRSNLSMFTIIGFFNISFLICIEILDEKEKKLKEYMRMLGLMNWVNWLAWFFKYVLMMVWSSAAITIIYHMEVENKTILSHTFPTITFVLIFLYSLALIMFHFAITTFFSRTKSALLALGVMCFLSTFLEFYLKSGSMNAFWKFLTYLLPNLSLGLGFRIILNFEGDGVGVQWSSVNRIDEESGFSLLNVFCILMLDMVLYGIITWYVDAIHPGEFGSPQPFYFPFLKQYWCGKSLATELDQLFDDSPNYGSRAEFFESNTPNNAANIKIRNLTKIFKKGSKPAVNGLNLDICEGSIVALLGHNGAGKTTALSMLTGFIPPTKGSALINGFSIRNMDDIRQNLGYCPQSNILFDKLTVREHLYFFQMLNGNENVIMNVLRTINDLLLMDKKDTISKKLSGGMKRKLSIGIALVGNSKFVILDEPSSGLDTEARREIWDILKSQRMGRTMILSTHYMDEADYLADKIAIMAEGMLQCYGSSMFLKKKYGIGYQLTIVKKETSDPSKIYELITSKVPEAQFKSSAGAELTYHLPKESSSTFSSLFSEMEACRNDFGINTFGISVTSLEEVFIKVGELCSYEEKDESDDEKMTINVLQRRDNAITRIDTVSIKSGGITLIMGQIYAMLLKRFLNTLRNKGQTLAQILTPAVFTIIACIVFNNSYANFRISASPPFTLNLEKYDYPITIYATVDNTSSSSLLNCYMKALNKLSGSYVYLNEQSYNYNSYKDMDNYFLEIANKNLYKYHHRYQIATEIGPDYFMGFFNDISYHSMAITLTLINNGWLQCLVGPSHTINTINHPVPISLNRTMEEIMFQSSSVALSFFLWIFNALAYLLSSFSLFLITERKSGAKVGQYISGATSYTFWLATFLWDYFNYIVPSILLIIITVAFQVEGYSYGMIPSYLFLGLVIYGWSSMPLVYLLTFLFSKASTGFNWIYTLFILTGIILFVVTFFLPGLLATNPGVFNVVEWVLCVTLPTFCLINIFKNLLSSYTIFNYCSNLPLASLCSGTELFSMQNECCPTNCEGNCLASDRSYLSWEGYGIGKALFFMATHGMALFLVLLFVESDVINNVKMTFANKIPCFNTFSDTDSSEDEDDDVLDEKHSVTNLLQQDLNFNRNVLILNQLKKRYSRDVLAVNNICLKVPSGECFGLLGVNGAGKTSTFKMMTGEEVITGGEIYVNGINVAKELTKTRKHIGYCPQFDSLFDQLTVKEHLELHARLRGIPRRRLERYVTSIMQNVVISEHSSKRVQKLSGGNKRKLCVAIALIGHPNLLFLDEPTTGIDPVARREMWNLLSLIRQTGCTIILTSHSMEECEALCTRLAIMVNGQFKCLGSAQHLKSKFGSGYSVVLKIVQTQDQSANMADVSRAKEFILNHFPGSTLEFEGEGLLNYRIEKSTPGATLSNIFGLLEGSLEALKLDDYSVGQATLEQIFINFALKQQKFMKTHKNNSLAFNAAYDETSIL